MSDLVARLQAWREAVILPRWIIDDVKELVRAKAELEAKLEVMEKEIAKLPGSIRAELRSRIAAAQEEQRDDV